MTHFVVIRHGQTEWNLASRIQGHLDSALTEAGRAQARALARRLAAEPAFELLVSSDLGRALATARAVARATGLEPVLDARFRERSFGVGEGLGYAEIDRRYPDSFRPEREIDPDFAIPGGESRRAFHERVANAFESLARERPEARIVVVSHGGVLGALYRHIHRVPVNRVHRVAITNASYNAFTCADGRWTVLAWGDAGHLPEGASSEET